MAMKEAEMGTELVDHLTPEEREQLSRLNPEIKDLKEKHLAYTTDRIEVGNGFIKKTLKCCLFFRLISDLRASFVGISLIYVLLLCLNKCDLCALILFNKS